MICFGWLVRLYKWRRRGALRARYAIARVAERFAAGTCAIRFVRGDGAAGREHLLTIVSDESLGFDWLPNDPKIPAWGLTMTDADALLIQLRRLDGTRWTALSSYFDVVA